MLSTHRVSECPESRGQPAGVGPFFPLLSRTSERTGDRIRRTAGWGRPVIFRAYASAMQIIEGAGAWRPPATAANDWVEHLKTADLSVGTYCIPAGGSDDQSPHTEDEIYVVTAGRATIVTPAASADVGPGSVIFVPAGEEHRFAEVTENLALLVVFSPAYGSGSPAASTSTGR